MLYAEALKIAESWAKGLKDMCERVEIAGSVRRGKEEVKDIELVAVPIQKSPAPVFGQKKIFRTLLDQALYNLEKNRFCEPIKGGDKYKQFWILKDGGVHMIKLDLFLVTVPAQWGVQMLIRTGPADFSQWCVTQESKGGRLPDGYRVAHGAVWREHQIDAKGNPFDFEEPLQMPDEADFLDFLQLNDPAPSERVARWR